MVLYAHTGFSQVRREFPDHNGAVDANTPQIEYAYDYGVGNVNAPRLSSLKYPQGSRINYVYDAGLDDSISRVSGIEDANNIRLVDYQYLGLGTPVIVNYQDEPAIRLDYSLGTSSNESQKYKSWDRFGRVTRHDWVRNVSGNDKDIVKVGYAYDLGSNRTMRNERVAMPAGIERDELYTYDGLNRLINLERGKITGTTTPQITTTDRLQTENWSLDQLGNWNTYQFDGDGDELYTSSADLNDGRSFNLANEIDSWDPAPADSQNNPVTPTYDRAGNITDDGDGMIFTYDAWNRLVKAERNTTTLGTYAYDGLGRRIKHNVGGIILRMRTTM